MNHLLHLNEHLDTPTTRLELARVVTHHSHPNDAVALVEITDASGLRFAELHLGSTFRIGEHTGFLASVDLSDASSPACVFHLE